MRYINLNIAIEEIKKCLNVLKLDFEEKGLVDNHIYMSTESYELDIPSKEIQLFLSKDRDDYMLVVDGDAKEFTHDLHRFQFYICNEVRQTYEVTIILQKYILPAYRNIIKMCL